MISAARARHHSEPPGHAACDALSVLEELARILPAALLGLVVHVKREVGTVDDDGRRVDVVIVGDAGHHEALPSLHSDGVGLSLARSIASTARRAIAPTLTQRRRDGYGHSNSSRRRPIHL